MTFSEFAKMMYPLIGAENTTSDFISILIDKIMETPKMKEDIERYKSDDYNPLHNCSPSMLRKIYNGKRELSRKKARIIRAHLDKDKFQEYLTNSIYDVAELENDLVSALKQKGIEATASTAVEVCTELFASIINNCAQKSAQRHISKAYFTFPPDFYDRRTISDDSIAQMQRELPRWSSFYKK